MALATPTERLGRLLTWTTFYGSVTADIALVWVEPDHVAPTIQGLGLPAKDPAPLPNVGDELRLSPRTSSGVARTSRVATPRADVTLPVRGPDWSLADIVYRDQIICEPMFSQPGDSGAVVLDRQDRIVGMVIGGRPLVSHEDGWTSQTIITPISAILRHPDFCARLEILTSIPSGATPPN